MYGIHNICYTLYIVQCTMCIIQYTLYLYIVLPAEYVYSSRHRLSRAVAVEIDLLENVTFTRLHPACVSSHTASCIEVCQNLEKFSKKFVREDEIIRPVLDVFNFK